MESWVRSIRITSLLGIRSGPVGRETITVPPCSVISDPQTVCPSFRYSVSARASAARRSHPTMAAAHKIRIGHPPFAHQ
jgi:hypothetical protein